MTSTHTDARMVHLITNALRAHRSTMADAELVDAELSPIGVGALADTFRVRLTWNDIGAGPRSLVLKRPAQDGAAAATAASLGAYEREARFYTELAPHTSVRVPRLLGVMTESAAEHPDTILLEDLTADHRPGDQLRDTPVTQLDRARHQLALLQAPFWDDADTGRLPWLHRRLGVPIPAILERMQRSWRAAQTGIAAAMPAEERDCIERFVGSADAWARSATGPWSLVHHDFRVDNMLFSDDETVVIDWQTVGWGPVMFDFAYLMGTSVDADTRRAIERQAIATHLTDLAALGVSWTEPQAWEAYRWSAFAVLLMLVPPISSVKSNPRMESMYRRLLSLGAQMVLDLDSLELLPA
ncbi:aminoglycoside phosphotransferase family protein [Gordonia rhizosphera]|uniref:Aminoglycoside phosphotransferase domain-containing protein n=1 Tax=Gordonia rhizosphera NBRC 16068 TaxID=1108045 RepID=K6WNJ5_9ACTN|nr:aminoglycoside phosphotransferase family protein [Gordonia rhizosphera]GAB93707.1 hypothetical protein GORHZ_241_00050 [Gordonia rhizosphera NBRC 16068]